MWIPFAKPRINTSDVILTGIPRSGTTLTCHLLNKLDNVVALHEPIRIDDLPDEPLDNMKCRAIRSYFKLTRKSISKRGFADSKTIEGEIPTNHFGEQRESSGLRRSLVQNSQIQISKSLTKDFLLVVKHPGLFTALLPDLIRYFPCYAVIRNPLSVLASWNSVALRSNDGRMPVAERWNKSLRETLSKIPDRFDRQFRLLSWYYETYHKTLPDRSILYYEKIVSSGGKALSAISPNALFLNENLVSRNKNELYDSDLMQQLGQRMLKEDGGWRLFYSIGDIRSLTR